MCAAAAVSAACSPACITTGMPERKYRVCPPYANEKSLVGVLILLAPNCVLICDSVRLLMTPLMLTAVVSGTKAEPMVMSISPKNHRQVACSK
jgi:hypothetical protein